jgi:hypothetical protein
MKKEFNDLCKKLYEIKNYEEHTQIRTEIQLLMLECDLSDYLLEEMEVQKEKGNWVNLFRLIFLVQKLPITR